MLNIFASSFLTATRTDPLRPAAPGPARLPRGVAATVWRWWPFGTGKIRLAG